MVNTASINANFLLAKAEDSFSKLMLLLLQSENQLTLGKVPYSDP